ncbi:glutathione S-transferase family protein [Pseudomonas sp. Gutcm_11s]|uniref:glutathione S-transferase family protein n=1 Tax=Pseudomonas sp. Gutcm_11s TaxID=3026088 RepID=UPI00235F948E|nr:glutathione S-transferase [Pseudomonas sp. Gutcm_11s]MDD0842319.1 glutathione S-transferase [Pseudomonas sp. Gutcm_11s]
MLRLHGFAVSNYYNMVHLALLEKGLAFETVTVYGCQDEDFLAISPRGKVPVLQTEHGYISETSAILDYLEDLGEGRPLLPAEPFARAQVRSLVKEIELYIELPARSCYPQAFFRNPVDQAIRDKARAELQAGIATLKRHGSFAPYVAGEQFSIADLYFLYSIDLAAAVAQQVFDFDLLQDFPAARELLQRLQQNPHVKMIAAQKEAGMAGFMAFLKSKA